MNLSTMSIGTPETQKVNFNKEFPQIVETRFNWVELLNNTNFDLLKSQIIWEKQICTRVIQFLKSYRFKNRLV